jgi:hypothetical protein
MPPRPDLEYIGKAAPKPTLFSRKNSLYTTPGYRMIVVFGKGKQLFGQIFTLGVIQQLLV